MQPSRTSLARSRAYALFSRLYREGVTTALLPAVQAVSALADTLPEPFEAEQAAADYYDLFHLNVFPYASLFLDDAGQLGGPVSDAAQRLFRQTGYTADTSRESADHIGHALGLLAFLTGAEADAWEDSRADEAARMHRLQRRFFDMALLWWLPAFVHAVRRHNHPFYALLGDLTLDLVLDHRAALGPPEEAAAPMLPVPDPPALLDDAQTGLKDIAAYLTTPAWCGFYLSRADLARLGRAEHLPRGFGARAQMLTNLLRAAADFDRLDLLLTQLQDCVTTWQSFYTTLYERDVPCLDAVAQTWLERLEMTKRMIDQMREASEI